MKRMTVLLITRLLFVITLLSNINNTSNVINNSINTSVRSCAILNTKSIHIVNNTIGINNCIVSNSVNDNLIDDDNIGNIIIDTTTSVKHMHNNITNNAFNKRYNSSMHIISTHTSNIVHNNDNIHNNITIGFINTGNINNRITIYYINNTNNSCIFLLMLLMII